MTVPADWVHTAAVCNTAAAQGGATCVSLRLPAVGEQTQGGWLPSLLGWAAALAPGRAPKWQVLTDGAVRDAIKWRVPGYDRQPR